MDIEAVEELEVDVENTTPRGYSAYEVYVQNGGTLTETEWLESLKGETGSQGEQGIQGEKGDKGDKGDTGEQGIQGIQGEQGDTGNGISKIEKTGTVGNVDTYTIYFTDNTQTTFTVTNGLDAVGMKIEVVTSLPTTGANSTLYLVPKEDTAEQDIYDEYVYTNSLWEHIGNTSIDLSSKQDVLTAGDNIEIEDNVISAKASTILNENKIYTLELNDYNLAGTFPEITDSESLAKFNSILTDMYKNRTSDSYLSSLIIVQAQEETFLFSTYGMTFNRWTGIYLNQILDNNGYTGTYDFVITGSYDAEAETYTCTSVKFENALFYHQRVLTTNNRLAYTPTSDYNPATKKYVDDTVSAKQDTLTAGDNIIIENNIISANVSIEEVIMPNAVFSLTTSSTSDEIVTAFGGEDNLNLVKNAIANKKPIYVYLTEEADGVNSTGLYSISQLSMTVDSMQYYGFSYIQGGSISTMHSIVIIETDGTYMVPEDGSSDGFVSTQQLLALLTIMGASESGTLDDLNTTDKTSLVNAINEVNTGMKAKINTDEAQTITGVKTFSVLPESSATPTTDNQLVNKKYVDDLIGGIENGSY